MSVIITNITEHPKTYGEHSYVLKINEREVARFTHIRERGLAECLRKAADAAEKAKG